MIYAIWMWAAWLAAAAVTGVCAWLMYQCLSDIMTRREPWEPHPILTGAVAAVCFALVILLAARQLWLLAPWGM